jgi:omega-amidase
MEGVDIALVSFCDVSEKENKSRYNTIQAHLITRAVENSMYLLSANSISKNQTAPTCLINPDGKVLQTAPGDEEYLLWFDYEKEEPNFGRKGRIEKLKNC